MYSCEDFGVFVSQERVKAAITVTTYFRVNLINLRTL